MVPIILHFGDTSFVYSAKAGFLILEYVCWPGVSHEGVVQIGRILNQHAVCRHIQHPSLFPLSWEHLSKLPIKMFSVVLEGLSPKYP